jgi:hypothetical protein
LDTTPGSPLKFNRRFGGTRRLKDTTPGNPLKFNRRFGGTRRLNLQGRKIYQVKNQHEKSCKLHGVTSQKIELFMH